MEEDWYSYTRGTLVAGTFSKVGFQAEVDKVNQAVESYVKGYFDAKPARYKLQASPLTRGRVIELEEIFADDLKRLEPDWSDRKIQQYKRYKIADRWALLFPFHKLAFVLWPYKLKDLPKIPRKLEELGYRISNKRNETEKGGLLCSNHWSEENYREVLRELRTKEHLQEVGIDRRTREIVEKVNEMINADSYQFGVFIPQHWVSKKPLHKYDDVTNELVVSPVKKLIEVPGQWTYNSLEGLVEGLDLTRAIGLTSRVQTKEGIRHIPMIDFGDPHHTDNTQYGGCEAMLFSVLDKVNMKGIIISSGNSYHFYGDRLLKENEWRMFMEMLKEIPFVDDKWPDLQLRQGFSMLRITPSIRKFTQPNYLRDYFPKGTGTDFDSLVYSTEIEDRNKVAA